MWPVTSDVCIVDDDGVIHRQQAIVAQRRFSAKRGNQVGAACGAAGVPLATAAQLFTFNVLEPFCPAEPAVIPETTALVLTWPPPARHRFYADPEMPVAGRCRVCWVEDGKKRPSYHWKGDNVQMVGLLQYGTKPKEPVDG